MSQENVDVMRRGFEVINSGDLEAILALVDAVADPDMELRAPGRLPDATLVRGREAVKFWWAQLLDAFEWRLEAEEFIDAGDSVVVVVKQVARGRASGAETTNRMAHLWGFRDGKLLFFDAYKTKDEALEAAGLRE